MESKRFADLIGCGDQLEGRIKVTPKFLALGGGTFAQGRSRLEGDTVTSVSDRVESEIQIRYPGSFIHGQSQPLAHGLSVIMLINICDYFTSKLDLSVP